MIWVDANGLSVDEDDKLHSYDDQPVESTQPRFNESWQRDLSWYHHGLLHRDEDKAAKLVSGKFRYWFKMGLPHRTDDAAVMFNKTPKQYILYNASIDKKTFQNILKRSAKTSMPLWVSWLVELEFISSETAYAFINEDSSWNDDLPAEWLLKAWNINKTTIIRHSPKKPKYKFVTDLNSVSFSFMDRFIDVINYEKANGEFYSTSTI